MRPNRLNTLFRDRKPIINGWLSIASAYSAEIMGHQGFDSVTVDLQHGMIGFEAAIAMLQALSSTPAVPLARVSKNDYHLVMQLLDAGAYGIICPMISSREEAERFVSFCRYPPDGQRSFGPARGLLYGGSDYFAHANTEIMSFAMLETREAIATADDILSVEGLTGIYVGPNDLCLSHGLPPKAESDDEPIAGIIRDLAARCRAKGRIAGIFCSGGAGASRRIAEGYTMVTPGSDVALLGGASKAAIAEARQAAASSSATSPGSSPAGSVY